MARLPSARSRVRRTIAIVAACAWATSNSQAALGAEAGGAPHPEHAAAAFAQCEPPPNQPWTYERLMCLRQAGAYADGRAEVVRRLRAMGGGDAGHPWPTLVLAHVTLDQLRRPEAIALYETAAAGFARSGEADGEVVARQNLANQYRLRGDAATAGQHVARAVEAAEASRQPLIIARAAVLEAVHALATGGDVGHAHRVLLRADHVVPPTAPIGLRRTIVFNLATASMYLGLTEAAIDALERHRRLRAEDGSPQNAATVEFNLLIAHLMIQEQRPRPHGREELVARAEAVLADAQALKDPLIEARAHQVQGDLLAATDATAAAAHLHRCLDLERTLGFPTLRARCLWSLARVESGRDVDRAQALSDMALSLLDADRDRLTLAYAWQSRMRLAWRLLSEDAAIAQSREALDAIERLRSGETPDSSRAGLFGNWVRDYQWLTGRLLGAGPALLAQAFEVGERLRARVLLERVARAGTTPNRDDGDAAREQVDRRIADTQRRMLSAPPSTAEGRALLGQLRLLEIERDELSAHRAPAPPSNAVTFASLDAVQQLLDDDEAMVWFSLAPSEDAYGEFGGGAWAITITRHRARIHHLANVDSLDAQVAALNGQLRSRDTDPRRWTQAAGRLGHTLLGDALADVPATATRLVIVTDGALHRMPFEILSPGEGHTLVERFEISEAPSATLWMHMRQSPGTAPRDGVFVLADPDVPQNRDSGFRLDRLPGARREAHAIARILDVPSSDVALAAAASERLVKTAALDGVGILHLAAHARADTAFPERSAVFLAPGDQHEDGWLQPSEIAELDLRGRLVVLSACDSAEGSLLSGEGPLSLARAFFAAGARAVVATRWPLRDDDAAFMMERFYEALGDGASVAAALRHARREAIAAGLPAAAWAGIAVLGDGRHHPIALRQRHHVPGPVPVSVIVVCAIAAVTCVRLVSRRARRRHR